MFVKVLLRADIVLSICVKVGGEVSESFIHHLVNMYCLSFSGPRITKS